MGEDGAEEGERVCWEVADVELDEGRVGVARLEGVAELVVVEDTLGGFEFVGGDGVVDGC